MSRGEDELMREWGKRRCAHGDIIQQNENGSKKLRTDHGAGHHEDREIRATEAEAQQVEWKRCSKTLLDDGQGKHTWRVRNGRLERPERKTKQVVVSSPSGRGQKERLVRERERQSMTVQLRWGAKLKPRGGHPERASDQPGRPWKNGGLVSHVAKRSGLGILKNVLGENGGLASHVTKRSGLGTLETSSK